MRAKWFICITVLMVCFFQADLLWAQPAEGQLLQALGQATVSLPASAADMVLAIRVIHNEAATVQARLNEGSQQLMSFLRDAGVQKLRTLSYRIQPKTRFENGKKKEEGFEGALRVGFQVELAKAGDLLDRSLAAGASEIESVRFTARDQELEQAKKQATEDAAKRALKEGKRILKSLDLVLLSIYRIDLHPNPASAPLSNRNMAFTTMASTPAVDLESGEVAVQAQVSVQLKYKAK